MSAFFIRYCGREIEAHSGQSLLEAILNAGEEHRHICGGHGFCTSCRVEVVTDVDGLAPVTPLERERLGREAGHLRLACQAIIVGRTSVHVPSPPPSRFSPDA